MTIYYIVFKIIIVFREINTYSASIFKEWRLLNMGGFVNSSSLTFQICAPPALILPLSSFLKINIEMLKNFILKWTYKHVQEI